MAMDNVLPTCVGNCTVRDKLNSWFSCTSNMGPLEKKYHSVDQVTEIGQGKLTYRGVLVFAFMATS